MGSIIVVLILAAILCFLVKNWSSKTKSDRNVKNLSIDDKEFSYDAFSEPISSMADVQNYSFKPKEVSSEQEKKMRRRALGNNIAILFKADGEAFDEKMKAVVDYLTTYYSRYEALAIKQCVKDNISPKCHNTNNTWLGGNLNYGERLALMELMVGIAKLYNGVSSAEWKALSELMDCLRLENLDVQYLKRKYSFTSMPDVIDDGKSGGQAAQSMSEQLARAYGVLGLDFGASADEVRMSFRRLSKVYHPDTVQDENLKKVLTEKFKEISEAYNLVLK